MENGLMVFEGKQVEVFEFKGKVLFNPRDVGECLGLSNGAVRMAMSKMSEKQVIKLTNSDVNGFDIRKLANISQPEMNFEEQLKETLKLLNISIEAQKPIFRCLQCWFGIKEDI